MSIFIANFYSRATRHKQHHSNS